MQAKVGVHVTHCCVWHGCKYGDDGCPVYDKRVEQAGPCEDCEIYNTIVVYAVSPTGGVEIKAVLEGDRSRAERFIAEHGGDPGLRWGFQEHCERLTLGKEFQGHVEAPRETKGVFIYEPDALERMGKVEGQRWLAQQQAAPVTNLYSFPAFKAAWEALEPEMRTEFPSESLSTWGENGWNNGAIYGNEGYARYAVLNSGEIVFIKSLSPTAEHTERARSEGFRIG